MLENLIYNEIQITARDDFKILIKLHCWKGNPAIILLMKMEKFHSNASMSIPTSTKCLSDPIINARKLPKKRKFDPSELEGSQQINDFYCSKVPTTITEDSFNQSSSSNILLLDSFQSHRTQFTEVLYKTRLDVYYFNYNIYGKPNQSFKL